ncbi:hypothetical protein [Ihuprevotella massiliensis]|uniref:hypothetical protein n=1 Tax=Ihuprevotella massiliensis TaxID=1852368 RepID=UPI00114CAE2E
MKQEIKQLECLSHIASAIIENPSLSLSDFGIEKENSTERLKYTEFKPWNAVGIAHPGLYEEIANLSNKYVITTSSNLSAIGLVAGATVAVAPASGASATGIGIAVAPFILLWGYKKYKAKKLEQEQKERMYREIIAKQQAAINRQKQINRELVLKLRSQNSTMEQYKKEIEELAKQISHLVEVIEVLSEQINQFRQVG